MRFRGSSTDPRTPLHSKDELAFDPLPFFGYRRVPLLKSTTKKSGYHVSSFSTGGPRLLPKNKPKKRTKSLPKSRRRGPISMSRTPPSDWSRSTLQGGSDYEERLRVSPPLVPRPGGRRQSWGRTAEALASLRVGRRTDTLGGEGCSKMGGGGLKTRSLWFLSLNQLPKARWVDA